MAGEAKFQNATFTGDADFGSVQAGGHLILNDATFAAAAVFDGAIVEGQLHLQAARFARPPRLARGGFARDVRLDRVCWPAGDGPAADLRESVFGGLLDLSDPAAPDGRPLPPGAAFWVDLTGATVERLALDPAYMAAGLDAGDRGLAKLSGAEWQMHRHQLMRQARLYEAALLREMRFDEADEFYRRASHHHGNRLRAWLLNALWGHGTRPFRVLGWMLVLAAGVAGLTAAAAAASGNEPAEVAGRLLKTVMNVLLAESPDMAGLQWWYVAGVVALMFGEVVLSNLFFAALARKLLR
jgi:hypothetical protein